MYPKQNSQIPPNPSKSVIYDFCLHQKYQFTLPISNEPHNHLFLFYLHHLLFTLSHQRERKNEREKRETHTHKAKDIKEKKAFPNLISLSLSHIEMRLLIEIDISLIEMRLFI